MKYEQKKFAALLLTCAFICTAEAKEAKKSTMPIYVSEIAGIHQQFDQTAAVKTHGTAQALGEKSILLYGDPKKATLYTVLVYIPAHTRIDPVTHPDDGFVSVLSGKWYVGFGDNFDKSKLKALTTGGVYTEPGNTLHFGETRDEPTVLAMTRFGPSGTIYGKKQVSK
ncbi:MAG: cupin domain-containing protein [Ottowia sp.]|nr:cupin domain-containing protein [Ottowia sp.]